MAAHQSGNGLCGRIVEHVVEAVCSANLLNKHIKYSLLITLGSADIDLLTVVDGCLNVIKRSKLSIFLSKDQLLVCCHDRDRSKIIYRQTDLTV